MDQTWTFVGLGAGGDGTLGVMRDLSGLAVGRGGTGDAVTTFSGGSGGRESLATGAASITRASIFCFPESSDSKMDRMVSHDLNRMTALMSRTTANTAAHGKRLRDGCEAFTAGLCTLVTSRLMSAAAW